MDKTQLRDFSHEFVSANIRCHIFKYLDQIDLLKAAALSKRDKQNVGFNKIIDQNMATYVNLD